MQPIDPRSGIVKPYGSQGLKLTQPLTLELDKSYSMQFKVNRAEHPLSLYNSSEDYIDGENNQGSDIWFKAMATSQWLNYEVITIHNDAQNQLVFDTGLATYLKAKMVNKNRSNETSIVNKHQANLASQPGYRQPAGNSG
ncbi:MAG: hypothetical protein HRU20_23985 [Pseudomonadales bacterium]|nr:hypothetical protein [Pseudomonadales bacterium]